MGRTSCDGGLVRPCQVSCHYGKVRGKDQWCSYEQVGPYLDREMLVLNLTEKKRVVEAEESLIDVLAEFSELAQWEKLEWPDSWSVQNR